MFVLMVQFLIVIQFINILNLYFLIFRGEETDLQDVAGLQYVIALSAGEVEDLNNDKVLPLVHFRVYKLKSYKSGQNYQELNWMKLVLVLILKLVEELLLLQMLKKLLKPKQLEAKVKRMSLPISWVIKLLKYMWVNKI